MRQGSGSRLVAEVLARREAAWPFNPVDEGGYPSSDPSYSVPGVPSTPASAIEQLSPRRRRALLQRTVGSGRGEDTWSSPASAGPCQVLTPPARIVEVAVLGSDGRYHPHIDGRTVCAAKHVQHAYWSLLRDGRYLLHGPEDEVAHVGELTVSWRVDYTDGLQQPAERIRPRWRCPSHPSDLEWPPVLVGHSPMVRLRRRLVEALGPGCQICRTRPAVLVDHDHANGMVRGYLCRTCNGQVDYCPHVAGCKFQAYLDEPPAAPLGLTYPNQSRAVRRNELRGIRAGSPGTESSELLPGMPTGL